ncbi:putative DNA-binding transcriptional regulator YafY [Paraburkholderia bannensis]|uniref:Putative DNA-binding transcriptional regulator YafY n=1 Tax=Paraburkholderia bannensis TaxID=765414 RepID=A0A7W9WVR7_9BURK|nr:MULTISPECIES: WYL domain-containing protein [Paraburkholderia]MBB3259957.1 putative DNA-binding transcriptional regulator YafY [Paraburkholderia sp. WP4_3_2]MBB6105163.1 putative DNA-binding transcriptional regulator YafY [Paraburkholderia bannensis]
MELEEILLSVLPFVEDAANVNAAAAKGIPFSRIREFVNSQMDKPKHERTIRRQLRRMAPYVDKVGETNGARWFKTTNAVMLSSQEHIDTNLAIALVSLDRCHYQGLPTAVMAGLEPALAMARARLRSAKHGTLARAGVNWKRKFVRMDGAQPLVYPTVDIEVYRQVSDALLHDRKLSFDYRKPADDSQHAKRYEARSPLGIVNRAGVFYLVVNEPAQGGPRLFRLDRIKQAKALNHAAERDANFNLDAYVSKEQALHFFPEAEVQLKLRIHASSAPHERSAAQHMLNEFTLHKDQKIQWASDRRSFELTATVKPSVMLRRFLHGQSDSIEVLEPASLREEFAARARLLAARYSD